MPEIIQIFTIERHLYGPDAVPYTQIRLPTNIQRLRERYKFSQANEASDPMGNVLRLICSLGEFRIDDVPRAVEQLLIEPNVVQFQINVSSDRSHLFLADLAEFLVEIDSTKGFSNAREYAKTYQTVAIVKMSVPFEDLLSTCLRDFLADRVVPALSLPNSKAEVSLERLGWSVTYTTKDTGYVYLPKPLTIEPRAGSRPSEMLYYTMSPSDFDTHLGLLRAFEEAFQK
jgi:hypothetical protein